MKVQEFTYVKDDDNLKRYKLLILKEDTLSMEGISLLDLPIESQNRVLQIYKEFEEKLNPFMKNYRKFIKVKVLQE